MISVYLILIPVDSGFQADPRMWLSYGTCGAEWLNLEVKDNEF